LVLIGLVAVLSPILSELTGKLAVPDVVIEIVLGIIIGPAVLAIAHPDSVVTAFSDIGLSYLMFLAGFELDLARIRGRSLRLAGIGWAISLGLALLIALVSSGPRPGTVIWVPSKVGVGRTAEVKEASIPSRPSIR
jgi:Kef-type K+ transport system membrane component KefB